MGNAVLSPGIFGGEGGKPKQLCKQSCPTNALAARLMQLRIKCLLSNDIEHILQFTNIKAFPIADLSVSIIKSSQNAVLLSTSQLQKEAVWQHSLPARSGKCCAGRVPSSQCCLLAPPMWHLLRGMGTAQIEHHQCTHKPTKSSTLPTAKSSAIRAW